MEITEKKYRVLFHGLLGEEEVFKSRMALMGAPSDILEKMLKDAPVILKKGLTLKNATHYALAVQEAGGKVKVQEHGFFKRLKRHNTPVSVTSFRDFTMCPECGFKQKKNPFCMKCGFEFRNMDGDHREK